MYINKQRRQMENTILQFFIVKDFIFLEVYLQIVYLGKYLMKLYKIKIYIGIKTTSEKFENKKSYF